MKKKLEQEKCVWRFQAPCGGIPAGHLTSATPSTLVKQIYKDLARADKGQHPTLKLLYVTPERLGNSDSMLDFMHRLHDQVTSPVEILSSDDKDYHAPGMVEPPAPSIPPLHSLPTPTNELFMFCVFLFHREISFLQFDLSFCDDCGIVCRWNWAGMFIPSGDVLYPPLPLQTSINYIWPRLFPVSNKRGRALA